MTELKNTEKDMAVCLQEKYWETRLYDYAEEIDDPKSRAETEKHLAGCQACRKNLENIRWMFSAMKENAPDPEGDITGAVMDKIRAEQGGFLHTLRVKGKSIPFASYARVVGGVAAAMFFVVATVRLLPFMNTSKAETGADNSAPAALESVQNIMADKADVSEGQGFAPGYYDGVETADAAVPEIEEAPANDVLPDTAAPVAPNTENGVADAAEEAEDVAELKENSVNAQIPMPETAPAEAEDAPMEDAPMEDSPVEEAPSNVIITEEARGPEDIDTDEDIVYDNLNAVPFIMVSGIDSDALYSILSAIGALTESDKADDGWYMNGELQPEILNALADYELICAQPPVMAGTEVPNLVHIMIRK
ncbi:MAG: zf-HC2 domain-containing protein [Clostridia bacterium]|nr:zf-HC2 domain-containing protein [Clostridia bacterium]